MKATRTMSRNSIGPIELCAKFGKGKVLKYMLRRTILVGQLCLCNLKYGAGLLFESGIWYLRFHFQRVASNAIHIADRHTF